MSVGPSELDCASDSLDLLRGGPCGDCDGDGTGLNEGGHGGMSVPRHRLSI